jgi:hypothetical protein
MRALVEGTYDIGNLSAAASRCICANYKPVQLR